MTNQEAIRELMFAKREVMADSFIDKAYDMAISALKTQIDKDINVPNNDDIISRREAIDALAEQMPLSFTPDGSHPADEGIFMAQEIYADCIETLKLLPSAQQEEAIPIIWLEKHIEWLQSLDNDFATLTAGIIIGTIAKWRGEQDD